MPRRAPAGHRIREPPKATGSNVPVGPPSASHRLRVGKLAAGVLALGPHLSRSVEVLRSALSYFRQNATVTYSVAFEERRQRSITGGGEVSLGFAPRPSTRSERPDESVARMRASAGLRVDGGGLRFDVSRRYDWHGSLLPVDPARAGPAVKLRRLSSSPRAHRALVGCGLWAGTRMQGQFSTSYAVWGVRTVRPSSPSPTTCGSLR